MNLRSRAEGFAPGLLRSHRIGAVLVRASSVDRDLGDSAQIRMRLVVEIHELPFLETVTFAISTTASRHSLAQLRRRYHRRMFRAIRERAALAFPPPPHANRPRGG